MSSPCLAPQVRALKQQGDQKDQSSELRGLLRYIWSHRGRLNYRDRLRRGRTIGSGQMEGMCKNTLNDRLRKNNPRWRVTMANNMAALCCLHTSDQWDTFWQHNAPPIAA